MGITKNKNKDFLAKALGFWDSMGSSGTGYWIGQYCRAARQWDLP
jgi:hypothetical protein